VSAPTIGKDKSGGDRRIKLPKQTSTFFGVQAKDKLFASRPSARFKDHHCGLRFTGDQP